MKATDSVVFLLSHTEYKLLDIANYRKALALTDNKLLPY
jgi:hypothetical protein